MSTAWPERPPAASRVQARVQQRKLPLRQRLDLSMLTGWLLCTTLVFGVGFLSFAAGKRLGWFDEEALQTVRDSRILDNAYTSYTPFLDIAAHRDHIYLSQENGTVLRHHPLARTWRTIPLDLPGLVDRNLRLLRPGNGDPAQRALPLWGLSSSGALAAHDRRWRLVTSDQWVGETSNQDLLCSDLSPDGRFELYGTRHEGAAIFDRQLRHWRHRPAITFPVEHIRYWNHHAWAGGPGGLQPIPLADDTEPDKALFPGWAIHDLLVTPADTLLVLASREGRTRIHQFTPEQDPELLYDEGDALPRLDLAKLHLAQQTGRQLWLGGDGGLVSYHADTHTWRRHRDQPVQRGCSSLDRSVAYFGQGSSVLAALPDGGLEKISCQDRLLDLAPGPFQSALALTRSNRVWQIQPDASKHELVAGRNTRLRPADAFAAIPVRNEILLATPGGIVMHDPATRAYRDIRLHPPIGNRPYTQVVQSGNHLFAVDRNNRQVLQYDATEILNPRNPTVKGKSFGKPGTQAFQRARAGIQGGLLMQQFDGRALHGTSKTYRWVNLGPGPFPDLDPKAWVDVIQVGDRFYAADPKGIHPYHLAQRKWEPSYPMRHVAALDHAWDKLVVRDQFRGFRLITPGQQDRSSPPQARMPFDTTSLSDAWQAPNSQSLFLAGDGTVLRYRLDARRVDRSWQVAPGPVTLIGVSRKDEPVSLAGQRLWRGSQAISQHDHRVLRACLRADRIWTLQARPGQSRAMASIPLEGGDPRDAFDTPDPGFQLEDVRHATQLPNGQLLVAGPRALHHYLPRARRWIAHPVRAPRLFPRGDHRCLFHDESTGRLLQLDSTRNPMIQALASNVSDVAVSADRIFLLDTDGGLKRLSRTVVPLAPAPGIAPALPLRRLIHLPRPQAGLHFVAIDAKQLPWQYTNRSWRRLSLGSPAPASSIDLTYAPGDQQAWLTATFPDGYIRSGPLEPGGVQLGQALSVPPGPPLGRILDMRPHGRSWLLCDDRNQHLLFDPLTRRHQLLQPPDLPGFQDPPARHLPVGDLDLWLTPDHRRLALPQPKGAYLALDLDPNQHLAITDQGRIYRLDPDTGRLDRSNLPGFAGYPRFSRQPDDDVRRLEVRDGQLIAIGPRQRSLYRGQALHLAPGQVRWTQPAPALDTGWFRWLPDQQAVAFRTPGQGEDILDASRFVQEVLLPPKPVLAASRAARSRGFTANAFGVFHHPGPDFGLAEPGLRLQPLRLTDPSFHHGLLRDGQRHFALAGGAFREVPAPAPARIGHGVVLHHQATGPTLLLPDGSEALTREGFRWDQRKRLRVLAGQVWVETAAGWTRPIPNPLETLRPTPPPDTPAAWVDSARWRWENKPGGGARVTLKRSGQIASQGPLILPGDQLLDAALHDGGVLLRTRAGMEWHAGQSFAYPAHVPNPPAGDLLPRQHPRGAQVALDGSLPKTWNPGRLTFDQATPALPLASYGHFRIQRSADKRLRMQLATSTPRGHDNTLLIDIQQGHFAFDRLQAILEHAGHVYLATDAGVEVWRRPDRFTGAGHAPRIWHLPGQGPIQLAAQDNHVVASRDQRHWKLEDLRHASEVAQAPPAPAADLLVYNRFWVWFANNGRIEGRYRGRNRQRSGPIRLDRLNPQGPRCVFPHDGLLDIAALNGVLFTLWRNGWTTSATGFYDVSQGRNQDLSAYQPTGFLLVQRPVGTGLVQRSIYLETPGDQLLGWSGSTWTPLSPGESKAVRDDARAGILYQHHNIRLSQPREGPPRFAMQQAYGEWTPLGWHSSGLLNIDVYHQLAYHDHRLWAATPEGLAQLVPTPGPRGILRGLIPYPQAGLPTDLTTAPGRLHLRFQHDSQQAWSRQPGQAWSRADPDPIADQTLFESKPDGWTWQRRHFRNGDRGHLAATWHGQPIDVAGGRFPFDRVNSLANFRDDTLDLTARGGWYTATNLSFALPNLRPGTFPGIDPAEITRLHLASPDELALHRASDALRLSRNLELRQTDTASEFQHDDGFWHAEKTAQGLRITTDHGQFGQRIMTDGRFHDQHVTGLPVSLPDRSRTWLPTRGGIFELDAADHPVRLLLPAPDPDDEDAPPLPRHLLLDGTTPCALLGTNLLALTGEDPQAKPFPTPSPPLRSLDQVGQGLTRIRSLSENLPTARLASLDGTRLLPVQHLLALDPSQRKQLGGDLLGLQVDPAGITLSVPGTPWKRNFPNPEGQPLESVLTPRHLFVLHTDALTRLDLQQALRSETIPPASDPSGSSPAK